MFSFEAFVSALSLILVSTSIGVRGFPPPWPSSLGRTSEEGHNSATHAGIIRAVPHWELEPDPAFAGQGSATPIWSQHLSGPATTSIEHAEQSMGPAEVSPLEEVVRKAGVGQSDQRAADSTSQHAGEVSPLEEVVRKAGVGQSSRHAPYSAPEHEFRPQYSAPEHEVKQSQSAAQNGYVRSGYDTSLTLAERHALAQAPWHTTGHGYANDASGWLGFVSIGSAHPSQQPVVNQGTMPGSWSPTSHFASVESVTVRGTTPNPRSGAEATAPHTMAITPAVVQADENWSRPEGLTKLQNRIASFRWHSVPRLRKPGAAGQARFYYAVKPLDRAQGLLRYAIDPDVISRISRSQLSGHMLVGPRDIWHRLNLRMLFAQSNSRAYGIVDAQWLKDCFPLLAHSEPALKDGDVAIIRVEKPGPRGYEYFLHSILNPSTFPHLDV